jgi:hypothetical protein
VGIGDHPSRDDFTGRQWRRLWLSGQYLDEVGQGEQRTAEHIRTDPAVDLNAVLAQDDFDLDEACEQVGDLIRGKRGADDKPAVQPVVGSAIRQSEPPPRVV